MVMSGDVLRARGTLKQLRINISHGYSRSKSQTSHDFRVFGWFLCRALEKFSETSWEIMSSNWASRGQALYPSQLLGHLGNFVLRHMPKLMARWGKRTAPWEVLKKAHKEVPSLPRAS